MLPRAFRARVELNATQRVIEAITGHRTVLFRPPYDIDSRPETHSELTPVLRACEEGYVTVAASVDPTDWFRHDPDQIVARCVQGARDGGVILLHDAGGDRSATVRALPRLIRALRDQGCRFVALHEPAEADHVRREDRDEAPLDRSFCHGFCKFADRLHGL